MENNQLSQLIDIIEEVKSNTSDIYDVKSEVENLGRSLKKISDLLDTNNDLLRELIDAVYDSRS